MVNAIIFIKKQEIHKIRLLYEIDNKELLNSKYLSADKLLDTNDDVTVCITLKCYELTYDSKTILKLLQLVLRFTFWNLVNIWRLLKYLQCLLANIHLIIVIEWDIDNVLTYEEDFSLEQH